MPRPTADATYRWHRLALGGADLFAPRATLAQTLAALDPDEIPAFTQFLVWHKLAALWHQRLETGDLLGSIGPDIVTTLHSKRIETAALYLAQRETLLQIDLLFGRHSITYVAIKGASVREWVYPDPSLRPASDIDILVSPTQRLEAARILIEAGYEFHADPENIDWEATFSRGVIVIDLHWNILRSGRSRCEAVSGLLERRLRQEFYWSLSENDTLVLMLIHPAFTKYVTSPNMALISVIDFIYSLRTRTVDWDLVVSRLNNMGLKTAAWTTLTWFRIISPAGSLAATDDVCIQLQPGPARQRYLRSWITNDLASHWIDRPLPVQLGFTLAMHDSLSDAARAILGWLRTRSNQLADPMLQIRPTEAS